jgi:sulfate adenylyltransferase subunit 2
MRVFPLSNWTEKPTCGSTSCSKAFPSSIFIFAKQRPVHSRSGTLIMVDDDRHPLQKLGETPQMRLVRFRTLGCYPLTGGFESDADTLDKIVQETLGAVESERTSRVIDHQGAGSMERRKREGYF